MTEFRNALAISQAQARAPRKTPVLPEMVELLQSRPHARDRRGGGKGQSQSRCALSEACDAGNALACDQLGFMHERGEGVVRTGPKPLRFSESLRRRKCEWLQQPRALHYNGTGVAQDKAQAAALYQKACDAGSARGCNNLGWMLEHGESVASDQPYPSNSIRRPVMPGTRMAATTSAHALQRHRCAQDKAQAAALYQKACDAGNAWVARTSVDARTRRKCGTGQAWPSSSIRSL